MLVATDGKIAGLDVKERGPGGTPPPMDIREGEIVAAPAAVGSLARSMETGELPAPGPFRIRAWSPDPNDRYAHLRPVIRFMQLRGNSSFTISSRPRPRHARGARDPLDLEGLHANTTLPSSLALRGEVDAIVCRNTRAEIVGSRGVKR